MVNVLPAPEIKDKLDAFLKRFSSTPYSPIRRKASPGIGIDCAQAIGEAFNIPYDPYPLFLDDSWSAFTKEEKLLSRVVWALIHAGLRIRIFQTHSAFPFPLRTGDVLGIGTPVRHFAIIYDSKRVIDVTETSPLGLYPRLRSYLRLTTRIIRISHRSFDGYETEYYL